MSPTPHDRSSDASASPAPSRRSFVHLGLASLAWQRDELAMFLHFGVNTFTDRA